MNEELARRMATKKTRTQYRVFIEYKDGQVSSAGTTVSLTDHQDSLKLYQDALDKQQNNPRIENPIIKVHSVTQTSKTTDWVFMP